MGNDYVPTISMSASVRHFLSASSVIFQKNPYEFFPLYNIRKFSWTHPAKYREQQNLLPRGNSLLISINVSSNTALGKVKVKLHSFLNSTLDGNEWSATRSDTLTAPVPQVKSSPMPTEQGAGLSPHLHERLWRREKCLLSIRNQTITPVFSSPYHNHYTKRVLTTYGCIVSYYNLEVWNKSNVRYQYSIFWIAT